MARTYFACVAAMVLLACATLDGCSSGATTPSPTSPSPMASSSSAPSSPAPSPTASSAAVTGRVTVSGTHLLRDGAVWTPYGYVMIAFVAPPAAQTGVFKLAYQNYSPSEFAAMKATGANTVRMQVSQPGLDPQNALFTQAFATQVEGAVKAARAAGLNVIVSVQDESQSGETNPEMLPTAATTRVWNELAPVFNGDTGILYELMNEPQPVANPADWQAWASAMNALIASIRATGSTNVVVADGLSVGTTLAGAPFLTDSANEVSYASHPYFHSATDQTQAVWAQRFGSFSATAPVIITEWTSVADATYNPSSNFYCDANTPSATLALFDYLEANGVGITAYAYDFDGSPAFGSARYGFPSVASSFANGAQCGADGFGPGTILQNWYTSGSVPASLE